MLLLPLLLKASLLHLASGFYHPFRNGFYYNHIMNDNSDEQDKVDYFSGSRLVVEASRDPVYSYNGANITLPCRYRYEPDQEPKRKIRIKWSKLRDDYTKEQDVMVAIGKTYVAFGDFKGRAHIRQAGEASWHEASLVISDVRLKDDGKFRCEVIDGLEDESDVVDLRLQGIVFPYQPPRGQYRLNFHEAEQVCQDQGAILANFNQLFQAWSEGLDWCNAGWLADGTVQYPIRLPRKPCGGVHLAPGIRSYGPRHRHLHRFDAFCFSSALKGAFWARGGARVLGRCCASLPVRAWVGLFQAFQMGMLGMMLPSHAPLSLLGDAWNFAGLDRCNAGWLPDGSVRYPIVTPRANCGPAEPGVRSFGFPRKGSFGVFCYRER
ncbi:hyaluronan and proteoglycan link protein 3 [Geospiza fortis]|uniref:Hyaluronan and proteoglycan link protein 3 n=1 Tax=Geospiza fortis TaxID=48883 RepID=A0A8N5EN55_GEOFO|nr:hyaluronan and proteoglycan link protein 3 [Geospiza fortis]